MTTRTVKKGIAIYRCEKCDTREAFTSGDPDWCPRCHAQGPRELVELLTDGQSLLEEKK